MAQDAVLKALETALQDFGAGIVETPQRLRGVLTDLLAEDALVHRARVNALVTAAELGAATRAASAAPGDLAQLESELVAAGVSTADATFAVNGWREVLAPAVAPTAVPATTPVDVVPVVEPVATILPAAVHATVPAVASIASDTGEASNIAGPRRWLVAAVAFAVLLAGGGAAFALAGGSDGAKQAGPATATTAPSSPTPKGTAATRHKTPTTKPHKGSTPVTKGTTKGTTLSTRGSTGTTNGPGSGTTVNPGVGTVITCPDGSTVSVGTTCPTRGTTGTTPTTPRTPKPTTPTTDPDRDKDGVPNSSDWCPDSYGPAANNGCPWGPPNASGGSYTLTIGQNGWFGDPYYGWRLGVGEGDTAPGGHGLTLVSVSTPSYGTATPVNYLCGPGSQYLCVFYHTCFNGYDYSPTFQYTIEDSTTHLRDTATITVNVIHNAGYGNPVC